MAGRTSFSRSIEFFSRDFGDRHRKLFIDFAKQKRDEAIDRNTRALDGRKPEFQTIVDGREGNREEAVKLGGQIVYLFDIGTPTLNQAVDATYQLLLELSPVRTGKYRQAHLFLVNGIERDAGQEGAPVVFKPDDVVSFTNLLPYARRIDRGWSEQAPNGVYESAYTTIRRQFGGTLNVRFAYDSYPGSGPKAATRKLRRSQQRRDDRFPTILLSVK
mgnify:CR=1 FL=1